MRLRPHLSPRRRTSPVGQRRPDLRRSAAAALAVVLVGGLATASGTAYAAPERALQSVDVELGGDGTVHAITSRTVSVGVDDESVSEDSFDPSAAAGDLPVRVLTSWRLDDRAGTDLGDIEGESGRVVVEVTVQNTTVRPELIEYDADGTQRSQPALVGAPLTVVASADLGEGALARVVTGEAGGQSTNGVLSRTADGDSHVQWAAMLAPPRLATTATFTLVQDTESFEVPRIDLAVQPGLVTDPSVQALMRSAFSEQPGSTLQLESQTIALLLEVNGVLAEAGRALDDVRDGLTGTVGTLGRQTIGELESSTGAVTGSLLAVAGSINSLEGQISQDLGSTSTQLSHQLGTTVSGVKALLGTPPTRRARLAPPPAGTGCVVDLPSGTRKAGRSIYEQVALVHARLGALRAATDDCAATIEQSLLETIGSPETCAATSDQAVCVIARARTGLRGQAQELESFTDEITGLYTAPVADLALSVAEVDDTMREVSLSLAGLGQGTGGSDIDDLVDRVDDLDDRLEDVLVSLQGVDVADLGSALEGVESIAVTAAQQQQALDAVLADDLSATAQSVVGLLTTVCAVPGIVPDLPVDISDFLGAAASSCDDVDALTDDLTSGVARMRAAVGTTRTTWAEVERLADLPEDLDVEGLSSLLSDSVEGLVAARTELAAVRSALGTGSGGLNGRLGSVVRLITSVYDPGAEHTDPGGLCPAPAPADAPGPALNEVNRKIGLLTCAADTIGGDLEDTYTRIDGSFAGFEAQLQERIEATDRARRAAKAQLDGLMGRLSGSLATAGDDILDSSSRTITQSRQRLDDGQETFDRALDAGVDGVLDSVATTVGSANRDLLAAEEQLRADLEAVLLDLGDPESGDTGILGALRSSASQTSSSTRRVLYANNQAADFAGLRSTALDDVYLQREQLRRSLQREQQLVVFGDPVAEGTSVLSVYSFHLGGS